MKKIPPISPLIIIFNNIKALNWGESNWLFPPFPPNPPLRG
jgi:hypothetical protein